MDLEEVWKIRLDRFRFFWEEIYNRFWIRRLWWVQAEGLNALFMSSLLNENEKHFTYFKKLYTYVEKLFRDKEYGEWYSILDRNGGVVCDYKGFELKGPYHITRCLMEISTFAEKYLLSKKER